MSTWAITEVDPTYKHVLSMAQSRNTGQYMLAITTSGININGVLKASGTNDGLICRVYKSNDYGTSWTLLENLLSNGNNGDLDYSDYIGHYQKVAFDWCAISDDGKYQTFSHTSNGGLYTWYSTNYGSITGTVDEKWKSIMQEHYAPWPRNAGYMGKYTQGGTPNVVLTDGTAIRWTSLLTNGSSGGSGLITTRDVTNSQGLEYMIDVGGDKNDIYYITNGYLGKRNSISSASVITPTTSNTTDGTTFPVNSGLGGGIVVDISNTVVFCARYVNSTGGIWRSGDSGSNWTKKTGDIDVNAIAMSADANHVIAGPRTPTNGNGTFYLSNDSGENWTTHDLSFNGALNLLYITNDGKRAIGGSNTAPEIDYNRHYMNDGYFTYIAPLSAIEQYAIGKSVTELINMGYSNNDIINAGYTIQELVAGGISVADLLAGGVSVADLITGGATVTQLLAGGVSVADLITGGVSVADLITGGATVTQLLASGVTITQLVDGGATVTQLLAGGLSQLDIDIALTHVKIHDAFTISDGTSSSIFATDAVYTPTSFAAKLTTDLSYSVTAGGDATTTDSTPDYRLYLQFANDVTLTGMPKYIFAIPVSDFSVGAGGQVNFRNVNLEAEMTIATSYSVTNVFGQIGADIDGVNTGDRGGASVSFSSDGSIVAIGAYAHDGSKGNTRIYKYSTGGSWAILGADIDGVDAGERSGQSVALSSDGSIVAVGANYHDGEKGTTRIYKYSTPGQTGGSWAILGADIDGFEVNERSGTTISLSSDGSIVAIGASMHEGQKGTTRIYKYSTPGLTGGSWAILGVDIDGLAGDQSGFSVSLSSDGSIVACGAPLHDSQKGTTRIYKYSTPGITGGTWAILGADIDGLAGNYSGWSVSLSSDGSIVAAGAPYYGSNIGTTRIYKYSTPGITGGTWAILGADIDGIAGDQSGYSVSLSSDGSIVAIGSNIHDSKKGTTRIYQYSTPGLTGGSWSTIGADIDGFEVNERSGTTISLSSDGSIVGIGAPTHNNNQGTARIYQLPIISSVSKSSVLPTNNYFINDFVSTIETDLVNYTLLYDASNALITFDGLSTDISMSITCTDTTIFDTTITEITAAANTLPFITYGQPDPTVAQYMANGMKMGELGVTINDVLALGIVPDWNFDSTANRFDQTYVKSFVDLSGSLIIHNDNTLFANGDVSINGNIINAPNTTSFTNELTLNSNLFAGDDISANGNLYVGGDLSVNGQFSGNFANGSIPSSAVDFGSNVIAVTGKVQFTGDVSFNGPTVDIVTSVLPASQIEFSDGTKMSTYNDNVLSGTFAGANVIFKDSTFDSVICEGAASATAVVTTSDYRIKHNVTELTETDIVDALVPIQYNNTLSGSHEYGLIAHELQEVYPELVNGEKDGTEYQRVNYNGLIGVLVKEIQDLKQRLAVLNH